MLRQKTVDFKMSASFSQHTFLLLILGSIACGTQQPNEVYYSTYLEIPRLLSLNNPLTTKHDEKFFITVHQMAELGFKQTIEEFFLMEASLSACMFDGDVQHLKRVPGPARRVVLILQLLSLALDTLRSTLEPSSFAEFRHALGKASGFQSWQFRMIEAQLGLEISERALDSLEHRDRLKVETFMAKPDFRSMLQHIFEDTRVFGDIDAGVGEIVQLAPLLGEQRLGEEGFPARYFFSPRAAMLVRWAYMNKADPRFSSLAGVIEAFSDIDSAVLRFRAAHISLAQYQIGQQPGTGGSAGVAYLEDQLASQVAFPEFQIIVSRSGPPPASLHADLDAPSNAKKGLVTDLVSTGLVRRIEAMTIRLSMEVAVHEDVDTYSGRSIDYKTLWLHADHLAERLRNGVLVTGSSGRVGVYCKKSIELVLVELAALKAGVCFVPLGISWPASRIRKIILDADIRVVVSDAVSPGGLHLVDELGQPEELLLPMPNKQGAVRLQIQTLLWGAANTSNDSAHPLDEAYMIYTSGTTGDPKGVVISKDAANIAIYSLLNLVPLALGQRYVTILTTQPIFDFSIAQIFCPLALGGTVVVPKQSMEVDGAYIAGLFMQYSVSVQALLPSMARAVVDSEVDLGAQLAHVIVAGEEFPLVLARDMFDLFQQYERSHVVIHNGYGPTENGIGACAFTMRSMKDVVELAAGAIPITDADGIFPYRAFDVIDPSSGDIVKHGKGELVISGKSLANGYHKKATQTKQSFRPNPHRNGDRSYWTGDMVEVDEHGRIYFRGRTDDQVKLRGFRIELHEVEQAARAHGQVIDVVAMVGGHLLLLYVVAKIDSASIPEVTSAQAAMRKDLRMICNQTLPSYAIPSAIILVESFPTTANGKIDKKLLPRPAREDFGVDVPDGVCEPLVPDDAICSQGHCRYNLVKIFLDITSEVVGFQVSSCDSWRYLGIDSVSAQTILAKAKQRGIRVSLADLYASKRISFLQISDFSASPQEACEARQLYPALPTQTAMLEATRRGGRGRQIVQLVLQLLEIPINRQRLKQAVQKVVEAHDGLRIRFQRVNGSWHQQVRPASELRPGEEWAELDGESPADIDAFLASDKSRGFQLEEKSGSLLRFTVGNAHLVVSVHHALLDGTSADLMLKQIMQLYTDPDLSNSTVAHSSVADYLCQASKLELAMPEAIEESPDGYVENHHVFSLHGIHDEAYKNKVTVATQLIWLCRLLLPGRAMGVIVSGRDEAPSTDAHGMVGMLIGYNRLPDHIQNVEEMQQEVLQLRMAPHTSAVGGFEVLVNVKHVAGGPGYQLTRVEETLGYPLVLEFFVSEESCRIHLQYMAKEVQSVAKVMHRLVPNWGE